MKQHESKKTQLKLDKANAQLAKLSNDASLLSRPHGLVLLNAIPGGRATSPVAVSYQLILFCVLADHDPADTTRSA